MAAIFNIQPLQYTIFVHNNEYDNTFFKNKPNINLGSTVVFNAQCFGFKFNKRRLCSNKCMYLQAQFRCQRHYQLR